MLALVLGEMCMTVPEVLFGPLELLKEVLCIVHGRGHSVWCCMSRLRDDGDQHGYQQYVCLCGIARQ